MYSRINFANIVLGLLVLLLSLSIAKAQDSLNVTKIWQMNYWPFVWDIMVEGTFGYVSNGSAGIRILDLSDPTSPQEIGCNLEANAYDLVVFGDYVYAADLYDVWILDVSNPNMPQTISFVSTPSTPLGLDISGNYLYVADGYFSGLVIFDISNPVDPVQVGFCNPPGASHDVVVSGDYAYLGTGGDLRVIDVSDPYAPFEVGMCSLPDEATGVDVSGDYAYVADDGAGLRIVDVSNPTMPFEAAYCNTPDEARKVDVSGNYAYVASKYGGLRLINVSVPTSPYEEGHFRTPGKAYGVDTDSLVYVAVYEAGALVLDCSVPSTPIEIGTLYKVGGANRVTVVDSVAYITGSVDGGAGLLIMDVSDPTQPIMLGACSTFTGGYGVVIDGTYAYVAAYTSGLIIVDVSDLTTPVEVSSVGISGQARDVVVANNHAYVCDFAGGFMIVDVTDPANPICVGYGWTPGQSQGIDISGDLLYIADGDYLLIYDVSDPSSPVEIETYETPGTIRDVVVANNLAYGADGYNGLLILDVTEPTQPIPVSSYTTATGGILKNVSLLGDYIYMNEVSFGLYIMDVSDPLAPAQVGNYQSFGGAGNTCGYGDYACVADGGLFYIFDCSAALGLDVNIYITPLSFPVTIPPTGGGFDFNISIGNNGFAQQILDAWIMVTLPDSSVFGPVLGPVSLTLAAGTTIDRDRTQNVPGGAPAGTYTYEGLIGIYPDDVWDSDSFTFEKLITGDSSSTAPGWNCWGDSFNSIMKRADFHTPDQCKLLSTYPNPFNPETTISFSLPKASKVNLSIYDVSGRLVADLVDGWRDEGVYELPFDGSNLSSGIYLYRLTAGDYTASGKMVMIK